MQKIKKCTKCKQDLPYDKFYKNKLIIDGHSNYCIECTKINSKKYFDRKKEKLAKNEDEQFMKMMLLSNLNNHIPMEKTDSLMRILVIERLCKSILAEIDHLKRDQLQNENLVQN